MNLTKHYTYNFLKYFLLAFVIFVGFKGETAWSIDIKYNNIYVGESKEYVNVDKIDNGFSISVTNSIEEDGSTTAYFSPSKAEDLGEYGALSFHIENKSEGEIKLNFIVNENSKNYSLQDDDNVLVLEDNEDTLRSIKVSRGVFELEKDFKGTVYMPLKVLKNRYFEEIISWGMTITCNNGEVKNFDITNFSYVEKNKAENINSIALTKISGDIEIPALTVGEAIVDYKTEKLVKFSLKEEYKGVSLNEKGHLSVNSEAEEGDIKVFVTMENGKEFYFKVNIKKSLTQSLKGVTGESLATPSLDEVVNDDFLTKFLLNNKVLVAFRVILVLIIAFIAGVYLYWRGYFENNGRLKKKRKAK